MSILGHFYKLGRRILEKLDFLINYLLEENKEVKAEKIPEDNISKKRLYRSLCNIRNVKPISEEYFSRES